jgi:hypothetical protein
METVKAHETKLITARELFSMSYSTRELFTENRIASMKKKVIDKMKLKMVSIEFFENEGIIFYSEKEKEMTTIDSLKDYTISSGDLWKFGFINRKTGQITLLFGGNCVAKGRNEAIKYFEITKVVTTNKFENPADLIPFAHKD